MNDALRAVGIALIGAVLSVLLREIGFRGAKLVSVFVLVLLSAFAVYGIGRVIPSLELGYFGEQFRDTVTRVMKIIGVSYVYGISADVCSELGEGALSSAVLAVGRVEILIIILPTVAEIIGLGIEYMK